MKKSFSRILALVLALSLLLSFAACGGSKDDDNTTTSETTVESNNANADADNTTEPTTDTTLVEPTTDKTEPTENKDETALPESKSEILATYTQLMNDAKKLKPGYKKYEYQEIPKNKRKIEGRGIDTLLNLAGLFMTSKKSATDKPEINAKGSDMKWFPVCKADKGCLLTDTSAIKSAKSELDKKGNIKLTIVLKDEKNCEPYNTNTKTSSSNVGKMFNPLSKSDIDYELENNSAVKAAIKEVDYSLNYQNSTAILTYNPKTMQIVELEQFMYTLMTVEGKILFFGDFKGTAVLDNVMKIWELKY